MQIVLNKSQARALSSFFLDVARASLIGSLGLSVGVYGLPLLIKVANIVGGMILTFVCIKAGLALLEGDNE